VEVVDGEGHGTLVGQIAEEPVQAVEHGEGAIVPERGLPGADGGEQGLRERRGALEQPLALRVRDSRDHRLEQLPHAAVGEVLLELTGARPEAGETGRDGVLAGRPEQACLAKAGGGLDQDELSAALLRRVQGIIQLGELVLAFQKRRRSLDFHSTSQPAYVAVIISGEHAGSQLRAWSAVVRSGRAG
jgi:hypothetical protein